jgi:hypothetical protein
LWFTLRSRSEVGLVLLPQEPSPTVLGFYCGELTEPAGVESWTVDGSVVGRAYSLDVMTASVKFAFHAAGATQVPEHLLGWPAGALR